MSAWLKKHHTLLTSLIIFFGVVCACCTYYFVNENPTLNKQLIGKLQADGNEKYIGATIQTNYGDIEIVFLKTTAPVTIANFIKITNAGVYNNSKFSRLTKDFIQVTSTSSISFNQKKLDVANDEKMLRGVVATAGPGLDSNGQFFIVKTSYAPWLEKEHTIFAKVINGFEVIDKISKETVDKNGTPKKDILIKGVILK